MRALFTVVLVIGGLMVYETETHFPPHATFAHRAIPGVIYLVVLAVIAAMATARDNARSNRASSMRSSRGGSSYRTRYPY